MYIKFAKYHKIYAHPTHRSMHSDMMPTGAGLIFAAIHIISLLITTNIFNDADYKNLVYRICIGGFFIVCVGLCDDRFNIKPIIKLFGQVFVTILMICMGFTITTITNPFGSLFELNLLSIPITIMWYLIVMNAINLIDGLDGLAAGIAIISAIVLSIYSAVGQNDFLFLNSFLLIIVLLGYIPYNFPNARTFMGDTGSLYLGFWFASIAIAGNEVPIKGVTTITLLIPVIILFIPLLDSTFTIFRRLKNKQSVFAADKNHLHHQLIQKGYSKHLVVLICWLLTMFLGIIALGYLFISNFTMTTILIVISSLMITLFFYIYKKELFK
jgi:UDP-GlcNAc:undecaprenyl-phosphate GlcNAc-1-phosphate transferase